MWRPADWRVRTKLAVVLVIPALAFLAVAGLLTSFSVRQAVTLGETAEQVALGRQVTALVHELQFERDWTAGRLASAGGGTEEELAESLAPARAAVDSAIADFAQRAGSLRDRPGLRLKIAETTGMLDEVAVVRAGMDEGWLHQRAVFDGYTRAIDALLGLLEPPAGAQEQTRGLRELAEAKELRSHVRGLVHAVAGSGGFGPGQADLLIDTRAQQRAAIGRFRAAAAPPQVARFDAAVRGQAVATTARLENVVLAQTEAAVLEGLDSERWWSAATTELELVREVEQALLADVLGQVEQARTDQWRQTWLVTGVTLAILVLSLFASVGIGRSMGRSLRRLHSQAMNVAQVRLPDLLERLRTPAGPLPSADQVAGVVAGGADEVGDVETAFSEVHRAAVRLGLEQARMRRNVGTIFMHLARRSQTLVERQLELLDEVERHEEEPARLRSLFGLDHLATRMRRNNDSLLVLSGADTLRRYDEPVELHQVVMAALAEIEHYERVRDDVARDLHVVGHVVADLVHLLAELLDNATAFSDPDTVVMVEGRRLSADGAQVTVTDFGIGMTALALWDANQLLGNPPPADDVATAERMGLVVVGHLAARHGVRVWLEAAAAGVRARMWLPEQLLTEPPVDLRPVEPAWPGQIGEGPRVQPTRAEDVLGRPGGTGQPPTVWFARPDDQLPGRPAGPPRATSQAEPPAPGAAAGPDRSYTSGGLPVRKPMAQTPPGPGAAVRRPQPLAMLAQDPAEAGRRLADLYGGVRRAVAEFDTDDTQELTPIQEGQE